MSKTLGDLIREECSGSNGHMNVKKDRLSDLRAEILDDIFNDLCHGHICGACPYRDPEAVSSYPDCLFVRVMEAVKEAEYAKD